MTEEDIIKYYNVNKHKSKYQIARELNLNKNYFCSLIDRYFPNLVPVDLDLENKVLEYIKKYPFTGTVNKISNELNISCHSIRQLILKTKNKDILEHFKLPKSHCKKLTDSDIIDILEGSKLGIGNDLMGVQKGVDGVSIRNVRRKFLTKEEYSFYHNISRFYNGDYNSYTNDRGDKFLSTWEEKIADYLFELGIEYSSNVRIYYKGKNYCPDLYLPKSKVFIEIFGLSNYKHYIPRMEEKIKFYDSNNIKCLYLFEENFQPKLDFASTMNKFLKEIKNKKFNKHIKNIYIEKHASHFNPTKS